MAHLLIKLGCELGCVKDYKNFFSTRLNNKWDKINKNYPSRRANSHQAKPCFHGACSRSSLKTGHVSHARTSRMRRSASQNFKMVAKLTLAWFSLFFLSTILITHSMSEARVCRDQLCSGEYVPNLFLLVVLFKKHFLRGFAGFEERATWYSLYGLVGLLHLTRLLERWLNAVSMSQKALDVREAICKRLVKMI